VRNHIFSDVVYTCILLEHNITISVVTTILKKRYFMRLHLYFCCSN